SSACSGNGTGSTRCCRPIPITRPSRSIRTGTPSSSRACMSASSAAAEHAAMANSNVLALPIRGDVWRGRRRSAPVPALPTGHAGLDALLPARGWPVGMLCEILHEGDGVGELRVVMPALAQLARQARPVIWIAPPYQPYAPALDAHGLPLSAQRIVQADNDRQALWAA